MYLSFRNQMVELFSVQLVATVAGLLPPKTALEPRHAAVRHGCPQLLLRWPRAISWSDP